MSTPGYPDYTRYARAGNQQLCGFFNTTFPNNMQVFKGYVGSWPYTCVFMDLGTTADSARFQMIYYSDATFTQIVGFRYSIRQSGQFSSVCYGNMSDWLLIQMTSQAGTAIPIQVFGAYATEGYSPVIAQDSMDVPIFNVHTTIAATTTVETGMTHVHPGPGAMIINSAATSWQWKVRYYDYNSNSIITIAQSPTLAGPGNAQFDCPLLDAPMFLDLVNNDAAGKGFIACLLMEN